MMGEEEGQWIKGKEEVGIEIPPHQQNLRAWKVRSDQISSVCGEGALGRDFRIVGQAMDFSLLGYPIIINPKKKKKNPHLFFVIIT